MEGMLITQLRLLFSFIDANDGEVIPCALISWFVPAQEERDPETGMWTVEPEGMRACRPVQVIPLKSITQGAHLLPKYGSRFLPITISHVNASDVFQAYFINPYIDYHCHKFLSG